MEQQSTGTCPPGLLEGRVGKLEVKITRTTDRSAPMAADLRIPLPPGVELAGAAAGVRQVQGALFVRTELDRDPLTISIPLRFTLPGTFTAREATGRLLTYAADAATARARPVVIEAR